MKMIKRGFALALALALVLSLSIPALAANGDFFTPNGSITVCSTDPKAVLKLYRVFDLASYNTDPDGNPSTSDATYIYRVRQPALNADNTTQVENDPVADAWSTFAYSTGVNDVYITIVEPKTTQGVESPREYVSKADNAPDFANFAALIKAYIPAHPAITPDYTITFVETDAEADTTNPTNLKVVPNQVAATETTPAYYEWTITGLRLGYYFLDSNVGSLAALNTTSPSVTITDKSNPPVIDKKTQEDSDSAWRDSNHMDIGQTVPFRTFVNVKPGAQNYVYHDTMHAGLTFKPETLVVKKGTNADAAVIPATEGEAVNYTLKTTDLTDGCTFEVVFDNSLFTRHTDVVDTDLFLYYDAVLNDNAVIRGEGTPNTGELAYGNGGRTEEDTTFTKTYSFEVKKVAADKPLSGAAFILTRTNAGVTEYAKFNTILQNTDTTLNPAVPYDTYQNITWVANEEQATNVETDDTGIFRIHGLDHDSSYKLIETKAPAGYARLLEPILVTISVEGHVTASHNQVEMDPNNAIMLVVENKPGSLLPSTGGTGTTMLYIIGSILTLGAAVLLVTKRRMNAN